MYFIFFVHLSKFSFFSLTPCPFFSISFSKRIPIPTTIWLRKSASIQSIMSLLTSVQFSSYRVSNLIDDPLPRSLSPHGRRTSPRPVDVRPRAQSAARPCRRPRGAIPTRRPSGTDDPARGSVCMLGRISEGQISAVSTPIEARISSVSSIFRS